MPLPKHKAADAKKIETERLQGYFSYCNKYIL